MSSDRISLSAVTGRFWSLLIAAAVATCLLPFAAPSARADETLKRVATMTVPKVPLTSFDIAFVDPVLDVFLLADRTNQSLDVYDNSTLTPLFPVSGFVGAATVCPGHSLSDCSGPNGVVTSDHRFAWVGDGMSRVRIVNLQTKKIIRTISTGGKFRADEVAVDPRDNIFVIANDADDPPFLTFISTKTFNVLAHLKFPSATNGLEQPIWDPSTGFFYLAVPELNHNVGRGAIAQISPKTYTVLNYFKVPCEPAGLALGPNNQALIGCSDGPVRVINLKTGHILFTSSNTAQADEVYYNSGDGHYYTGSGSDARGPRLGMIDAVSLSDDNFVKSVVGNHAVAADPLRNHIFLPSRADASDPLCTQGCVKVYQSGTLDTADDVARAPAP
jgi:hypothetical protein